VERIEAMTDCRKPAAAFLAAILLFAVLWPDGAAGQAASDAQIVQAARRIHAGTSTPADRATVITNNSRLNTLARSGQLAPGNPSLNQSYYDSAQTYFSSTNNLAAQKAARRAGVSVQVQPRKPGQAGFNPGTDTDLIVQRGPGGRNITTRQLNNLDDFHQQELKKIVRSLGQAPPSGRIDANTDFMPHPEHTSRETFTRQSNAINDRGGAAYTDGAAVNVEYQLRNPNGPGRISIEEAGRYVSQQQFHADRHFRSAQDLNANANALERQFGPNATAAQQSQVAHIREQARILQQNGAKYINRIETITDTVARQNHVAVSRGPETAAGADAMRAAGPRRTLPTDPPPWLGKVTAVDMATAQTAALGAHLTQKGVITYAETMARIAAVHPGQAAAARHSIARTMATLPPARQGEVIQLLERTAGQQFAQQTAREARQFQRPVSPAGTKSLTRRAMEAAGTAMQAVTIFNLAADVKEILTAEDPAAVLALKATNYADGLTGGSITIAERLGDLEHFQVEYDEYIRGVENVLYQALEAKLHRMGVDRYEARRISNEFYRGNTEPFRDKAAELRAAGVVDPNPERSGVEGVSNWDGDDTAMERLLAIGEGILQSGKRAADFAVGAVSDAGEIFVGLAEGEVAKQLLWERDPRLLLDIYRSRQQAARTAEMGREEMIAYLEALGASPIGARRAVSALLDDNDVSDFRRLVAALQERRARREAEGEEKEEDFEGEFAEVEESDEDEESGEYPAPIAEIVDAATARIIRDAANVPEGQSQAGSVIMSASGSWAKAYGGWRTEESPPNQPVEHGPFSVRPGKYRVHLTYSPDIPATMTAGNWNTGMSITFASMGSAGYGAIAGVRNSAGDKASGEGSQEFEIDRPGQLKVRFSMAASRGQAGGYAEHEQSYAGSITLLEPSLHESAEAGAEIASGDIIQAGTQEATVALWDGTMLLLRAGSEVRVEMTPEDRLRVTVMQGSGRFIRKGEAFGQLEVVAPDGRNLIRPRGTDFVVSEAEVAVVEGEVEIAAEGEAPLALAGGRRLSFESREESPLDPSEPALSADGFPLLRDYWMPDPEDYGEKDSRFENGALPGGWRLADPPGRAADHELEMETPAPGVLRIAVPANSRLDDHGDTAPRLIHKVTGDFILETEARLEGEGVDWAGLQFIARAPGSFAGSRDEQFPRTMAHGPGQHYWLGSYLLARTGGGVLRVPALNQPLHVQSHWPEAGEAPVRLLAARMGGALALYWSLDGEGWNLAALSSPELPETLWIGWALVNTPHAQTPAVFEFAETRLVTAPFGSVPPPEWSVYAENGTGEIDDDGSVRLVLDGSAPGAVRALSGLAYEGDFDVEARFDTGSWEGAAGQIRRWSFAAVSREEVGVAVGHEVAEAVQRCGVFVQATKDYSRGTAFAPVSAALEEPTGRLRLKREDGILSAYYWRGGKWEYWRDAPYRNQETVNADPLYLRLEVSHGHAPAEAVPMDVRFFVQPVAEPDALPAGSTEAEPPSPEDLAEARRLLAEAERLEAEGDPSAAVESYMESLALAHDDEVVAKIERLDPASLAPDLVLSEPHLAVVGPQTVAKWHRIHLPAHGDLRVEAEGYDILRFALDILSGDRTLASAPAASDPSNEIARDGLAPGDYLVCLRRGSGDGPYRIVARFAAQEAPSDPEPNDTAEEASPLALGEKVTGLLGYTDGELVDRDDWYAVEIEQPGDLAVAVEAREGLDNLYLYLYGGDARSHLASDASGMNPARSVGREELAPGTYFVRVQHGAGHGAYALEARLASARPPSAAPQISTMRPSRPQSPRPQISEDRLTVWLVKQDWFARLRRSLPDGVRAGFHFFVEDPDDGFHWVEIREVRTPESGYDPDVSPLIGIFRISGDLRRTEYLDAVTGELTGIAHFLESRSIGQ